VGGGGGSLPARPETAQGGRLFAVYEGGRGRKIEFRGQLSLKRQKEKKKKRRREDGLSSLARARGTRGKKIKIPTTNC